MSTTYNPDPTVAQSPAVVPGPDNFPALTLPAAGDGDTAASVAQAFKVLGDYIAFLKAPRSIASAWTQRLRTYLNARLQRRFFIDHLGFPSGNILEWNEFWDRTAAGTFGTDLGWISTPGSGTVVLAPPSLFLATPRYSQVAITPAMGVLGVPAQSFIRRADGLCIPDTSLAVACQWTVMLSLVGTNHVFAVHGLVPHASSTPDTGTIPWGARFRKASADTTWWCEVDGVAPVDSTVTPTAGSPNRFRIEIVGTGVSDDSAARVLFYIDDAQVANVAHVVTPTNTDRLVPFFGSKGDNSGSPVVSMYVGPVQYRQNMFQTV